MSHSKWMPTTGRLTNRRIAWIAGALVVLALVCTALAWQAMQPVVPRALTQTTQSPAPAASAASTPATDATGSSAPTATPVPVDLEDRIEPMMTRPPQAAPVHLTVPSVGISTDLEELNLLDDGSLATPVDTDLAGWYAGGAKPGAVGPAVIAGHVTKNGGKSVFFRLSEISKGDQITVAQEDGTEVNFRVTRVEQHPKNEFPTLAVYGNTSTPQLRLITCGGDFDKSSGHFYDNVIVFAQME